ncbi:T-lymphocyte activation antigen CD80 isoform X2 [Hemibagrus wyckioides]|uniref:T-lymphocyte activation antigen CD80 isoform X2 n=2 Tax=Hemibagrus wyckioides TaxID=337641 RepID=UPI00266CEE39|nr:T-lymphocyte activation antigen CD80 isoform X2 [Hemibagrus wyckioides]
MRTRARHRLSLSVSVDMWRGYLFLFALFAALQLISSEENPIVRYVHGIVGKSVHMRCVLDHPHSIERVYFQKKNGSGTEIFVNGFYNRWLDVSPMYINRTIINKTEVSMELLNLSLDDEGEYSCIPFSYNANPTNTTKFYLTVTATYSIPNISVQGCGIDSGAYNCVITCSSSGGFPQSNVTWHMAGGNMRSLLRDEGELELAQDKQSRLWSVFKYVSLNCTQQVNITCSVGGVVSQAVSLCTPVNSIDITAVACIVLLLVSFIIIIIIGIKCRTTTNRTDPTTDAELATLKSGWMNTAKHTLSENLN